ncbi:MAG TPA: type II toxin-antitoxin system HipA family toxin, partial [Aquirhabdus sp.]
CTLAQRGHEIYLEYTPEAIERGLELSPRHLPLASETYGNFPAFQNRLPGLIADCLPDGWGLLLMDRFFKKFQGLDPYQITAMDRLAFLGDRAMGALTFEPASMSELEPFDIELLNLAQDVRDVVNDTHDQALQQLVLIGGSPQGARPKALVQYDQNTGHISTHPSSFGTPWLVKFPAKHEPAEVCVLEYVYSEMARNCGIEMPATQYFLLPQGLAAFAIERFDRHEGYRVPMHTLAGALHADFRLPSVSYATMLRMTRLMTRSEDEVLKAYRRCVFNVVFNNRDDHAKNFSYLLNSSGDWQLSPGYDLTYCEGLGGEHQMDIEGEGRAPNLKHLMSLSHTVGLNPKACKKIIEEVAEQGLQFHKIASQYPITHETGQWVKKAIDTNLSRLH